MRLIEVEYGSDFARNNIGRVLAYPHYLHFVTTLPELYGTMCSNR
jgi:hypothetical protein